MNFIGAGIAFAGLCIAAAWLEINDKDADGLWIILVLWLIFGNFS